MAVTLNAERQRQAERYAAVRRWLSAGHLVVTAAYLGLWVASGFATALRTALLGTPGARAGLVAAYFLVFWVGLTVVSFPFSVSGWQLSRRFGLSTQTFGPWLVDWAKGEGIGLVLGLASVEAVYALLLASPDWWWLLAAALFILFTIVLAQLAPLILLPLFFKLTPMEPSPLTDRLVALARRAGATVRGVYRMNLSAKTTAANAALVGFGHTRRIVIGDTLLDHYTAPEIEVVFAHELGHQVHHDVWRGILAQGALTLIGFYLASLALPFGARAFGYAGSADVATLPWLVLVLGVLGLIGTPLGNWLSRWMETRADCYALRTTDDPTAFIATMTQLANQNLAVYCPPRWVELLLYDHPAIAARVAMAERFQRTGQCG
jgi:STE24 endopeptidase